MFAPARDDFIRRLPETFLESPLIDRFHGIIPGWEIPPFETDQQAVGLGLKADYFAEVCHALRSASHLSQGVRSKLGLSGGKRDCTAIERMACGLAKLLLISPDDPRFDELVIRPAEEFGGWCERNSMRSMGRGMRRNCRSRDSTWSRRPRPGLAESASTTCLRRSARAAWPVSIGRWTPAREPWWRSRRSAPEGASLDEAAIRREMDI